MATRRQKEQSGETPDQLRSGMAPDQWDAAIRLQCAVRDALDRPLSLLEALDLMTIAVRAGCLFKSTKEFQRGIDDNAKRREAERIAEQKRIANGAGGIKHGRIS